MKTLKKIGAFALALCLTLGCLAAFSTAADDYDLYPITNNRLLAGKTVFVDAGFGTGSGGSAGGYLEEEGNYIEAMLLKDNLERCGANVILTRPTREDVDSYARMSFVNKTVLEAISGRYIQMLADDAYSEEEKAQFEAAVEDIDGLIRLMDSIIADPENLASTYYNTPWERSREIHSDLRRIFEYENCELVKEDYLFISIHANSGAATSSGTVGFYLDNEYAENSAYYKDYSYVNDNRDFAGYLAQEVSAGGGFVNRGARVNNYYMLRELNIPAALVRVGFYTNTADRERLMNETYQRRVAAGMTYAVMKHFGVYQNPSEIEEYIPVIPAGKGDVNADGVIDNVDVVTLARYLLRFDEEITLEYADVNGDASVSNADLVLVLRHVVYGTEL